MVEIDLLTGKSKRFVWKDCNYLLVEVDLVFGKNLVGLELSFGGSRFNVWLLLSYCLCSLPK